MHVDFAGLCFTDAQGIAFSHDPTLVAISYLVAAGGSFSALEMIARSRACGEPSGRYWRLGSATVLGGSIWSMHFLGMLAVNFSLPMTYAPGATLLSLLIAIGVVGWGLQLIQGAPSWVRIGGAGIAVGLGVAAMHYVGMAGLRFAGTLAYRPSIWSLSLLIGVAAATTALWLSVKLQERWKRAVAALIMGGAICGMHYTGMAAAVFQIDPMAQVVPGLPSGPLAIAVATAILALMLCALVCVTADRRLVASTQHEAEALRRMNGQLLQVNAELETGRQQFDAVLASMIQGVCFFDGTQRLRVSNRRYAEIYNLPPEASRPGTTLAEIVDFRVAARSTPEMSRGEYLAMQARAASAGHTSNIVLDLQNGRTVAIHYHPMPDGGWIATHEDITERKQAEADLVFMARHDALTKLPNRVLFNERLEQAMIMSAGGTICAVLCIDLDHFKLVNDMLGHPVGDGLLQAAAARLQACVRAADTVARLGGDEFAIIQLGLDRPEDAQLLADRIIVAFAEPFEVDGHRVMTGSSVGVAVAPCDGTSSEKLLKNADIALYLAKTEGRGTVRFFEPEMDSRIHIRRSTEIDLRSAIAAEQFELYYQPLVNLAAEKVTGFEALIRWHHPDRGLISPLDFIPIAEETGMIVDIGEWVLRAACLEASRWPEAMTVAVNLSPVQFKSGNLVASVVGALADSGLAPNRLELEITESVLMNDAESTLAALHELRAMGVTVALDDFGTGYSSLSYLRSFPFDKIKIDQSFVRDLASNKESMSIVRAVTGLGHSLQMKTTAEGVETLEQLDTLRREGCTEVQGYVFSKPRPAHELPSLIASLQGRGSVLNSGRRAAEPTMSPSRALAPLGHRYRSGLHAPHADPLDHKGRPIDKSVHARQRSWREL